MPKMYKTNRRAYEMYYIFSFVSYFTYYSELLLPCTCTIANAAKEAKYISRGKLFHSKFKLTFLL